MFRVAAYQFGNPEEVFTHEPVALPRVKPGTVLIRMLLSPINPSDLIPSTGAYRHRTTLPFVPGFEGVGVVKEVGQGVGVSLLGRRVIPIGTGGNWQTYKVHPAEWCLLVPEDITDAQASMAYINPLTAMLMVRTLAIRPGDLIGITAAGSAIGRILMRMIAAEGGRAVAIVRAEASRYALRDVPGEIFRENTPLPVLAAGLDAVGGAVGEQLAAAIRPSGTLLHYGLLSGRPLRDPANASLRLFRLRDWVHTVPRDELRTAMDSCFAAIRSGQAECVEADRYPLASIIDALGHHARVGRVGKVLLQL